LDQVSKDSIFINRHSVSSGPDSRGPMQILTLKSLTIGTLYHPRNFREANTRLSKHRNQYLGSHRKRNLSPGPATPGSGLVTGVSRNAILEASVPGWVCLFLGVGTGSVYCCPFSRVEVVVLWAGCAVELMVIGLLSQWWFLMV